MSKENVLVRATRHRPEIYPLGDIGDKAHIFFCTGHFAWVHWHDRGLSTVFSNALIAALVEADPGCLDPGGS
jgi:hypothetical protein